MGGAAPPDSACAAQRESPPSHARGEREPRRSGGKGRQAEAEEYRAERGLAAFGPVHAARAEGGEDPPVTIVCW